MRKPPPSNHPPHPPILTPHPDEKNIQAILATQFKDFDIGPKRRNNFMPLLGNGIFTQDGAAWEHSRTMMRPQFARDQVSDLDLEEQHVQNMMQAIVPSASGWTDTLDLQVLFFRLTLDSATEFLFGESVDSQLVALPGYVRQGSPRDPSQDEKVFAAAFDRGQSTLATRSRLQGMYMLYNPSDFSQACRDCHAFIDHFVRLALSKPPSSEKPTSAAGKEKYVFLDALAAETRDPIELRSQLLNILLAGRDTTASLIGWVFFSLARDPARYAKLRSIILEEFGTFERPRDITFARLKGSTYLQHVNSEALRLYPVVPVNSRTANKDTTLPRGGGPDGMSPVFVPKGRACDYSVFVMHRRKDVWGEDADQFVPERWEKRRVGWDFLPVSLFTHILCYLAFIPLTPWFLFNPLSLHTSFTPFLPLFLFTSPCPPTLTTPIFQTPQPPPSKPTLTNSLAWGSPLSSVYKPLNLFL